MHNVQQLAATIVGHVMDGRNLNQEIKEVLQRNSKFSAQEKGALQDLCYGTLRNYGQLINIQNTLVAKPLQNNKLRNLLLVAIFQLKNSKAAPYAVVDHAVRAAKKINVASGGLVNAVLRNFLRRQPELELVAEATEEGKYSYQQWWIDLIKKQYGELAPIILKAGNQHPPMILRVNQRITTPERYLTYLTSLGLNAQLVSHHAIWLKTPVSVEKLPGFLAGEVSVQDAGAQYAQRLLDVHEGMRVLDACAAPGGKSAHLLEKHDIELVALDKDEYRLKRVGENMQRLKLKATLVCGDAGKPKEWWDGKLFDRVLADVPCSASGVVRRHPDIKWLRRPSDIEGFAVHQEQILEALWQLVARGGKLLYATCSVFWRENGQVIDNFLTRHEDAKRADITATDLKDGQLIPNEWHDGFFYALLQKEQ